MYASAYHRITRGPISRAIGSMLGNGIPVMEKVLSASVSGLRNGLTAQTPLPSVRLDSVPLADAVRCARRRRIAVASVQAARAVTTGRSEARWWGDEGGRTVDT